MYYNGRNDIIEPEDVIGVERIQLSADTTGRRFVALELEIPADLDLAPVEKLMICMPDGTTPRLFVPKQVLSSGVVIPDTTVASTEPPAPDASGQPVDLGPLGYLPPGGDGSVPLDALDTQIDQAAASGEPVVAAAPAASVDAANQATQEVPVAAAPSALPLIGG